MEPDTANVNTMTMSNTVGEEMTHGNKDRTSYMLTLYGRTPSEREQEVRWVNLTMQEMDDAIYEAQKKKWFRLRNEEYWKNRENIKP